MKIEDHSVLIENEELRNLRHEVEYLRQEVEFLKKFKGRYRGSQTLGICVTSQEKFRLIEETINSSNNQLLYELAGVLRSGYYYYINNKDNREQREYQELVDFHLIFKAYDYRGFPKVYRRIHMMLLHFRIVMNPKNILRLIQKYGLSCPIRRKDPYRTMIRADKSSKKAANIVDRAFPSRGPRTILLTDSSYLSYKHKTVISQPFLTLLTERS